MMELHYDIKAVNLDEFLKIIMKKNSFTQEYTKVFRCWHPSIITIRTEFLKESLNNV